MDDGLTEKQKKYQIRAELELEATLFSLSFEKFATAPGLPEGQSPPTMDMETAIMVLQHTLSRYPAYHELEAPIQSLIEKGLLTDDSGTVSLSTDGLALRKFCADHWFSETQNDKLLKKKISALEKTMSAEPYRADRTAFDAVIASYEEESAAIRKQQPPCPTCGESNVEACNFATWTGSRVDPDTGEEMQIGGMEMDGDCLSCGAVLKLDEGILGNPSKWVLRD
jgi:hypothetical protein